MRPAKGKSTLPAAAEQPEEEHQRGKTSTLANSSKLSISGSIWMHLPYLIVAELKPSVSSSTVTLPSWLGTCTGTLMVGQEWYSGFAALAA